jgi:Ca2+-transporting ATPase
MSELAHAYSSRSHYRNVFGGIKLPPNKALLAAIGGMTALQAVVSVVPGARRLLGTTPMGLIDLVAVAAGVLGPLIINEATKPSIPPQVKAELEGRSGYAKVNDKNTKQEQAA